MRKTLSYVAIAAAAASLSAPALAAKRSALPPSRPLVVTDQAGDANGINSQGGILPVDPSTNAVPAANQPGSDILKFSLSRLDNGVKPTALVGTLTLAAPPDTNRDFRIEMSAPGCTTYYLELEMNTLGKTGSLRNNCDGGATAKFDPIDYVIKGNSIIWTVPIKALSGDTKLGTLLSVKGAQVSVDSGAVVFPGIDEVICDKTYRVGQ